MVYDFHEAVSERIKGFAPEKCVHFAYVCALRALPFLSFSDSRQPFSYWEDEEKQQHLYSVFYAIDYLASNEIGFDEYYLSNFELERAAYSPNPTARSVCLVANAATRVQYLITTDACVASAASAATDFYNVGNAIKSIISKPFTKISNIILADIESIIKCGYCTFNSDVDFGIYGEAWQNFINDLHAVGCSYWARLYTDVFKNNFVFDEKELKRRMNVPDEIKAQGAAAVGQYLDILNDDVERLNESRIIILGEKGAGKTSLARKLIDINAEMPNENESTEGVTTTLWRFPDKDGGTLNAHIWDFAGHAITHAAHRCFMSSRCLYIYVYNGRIERDNDPVYWLEQIRIHGGASPVLFLINEKDAHNSDIQKKTLISKYPSIEGYYHIDIGGDDKGALEAFREKVMDMTRNNPVWNRQEIPAEAYRIKEVLYNQFDKDRMPHITREQFFSIAQDKGATEENAENIGVFGYSRHLPMVR